MSSSPSTVSIRRELKSSRQLHDLERYRQTVYHSGAGRHIAEARRRSRGAHKFEPATTANVDWVLYPTYDPPSSLHSRSVVASPHHPSSVTSSGTTSLAKHVTSTKRSSDVKPKATVIVDVRQSIGTVSDTLKPSFQKSPILTPPPTPRMERLPTPDLSDLDAVPLCDCGVEAHVVKFCTSCKTVSDSRSMQAWLDS
ncbi:Nn.00g094950.m01.CDS01 [Neocucurbitaria sp. VM-36]